MARWQIGYVSACKAVPSRFDSDPGFQLGMYFSGEITRLSPGLGEFDPRRPRQFVPVVYTVRISGSHPEEPSSILGGNANLLSGDVWCTLLVTN